MKQFEISTTNTPISSKFIDHNYYLQNGRVPRSSLDVTLLQLKDILILRNLVILDNRSNKITDEMCFKVVSEYDEQIKNLLNLD